MVRAPTYDPDQPWNRQPFDTDLAWAWFCEYLQLSQPRRLVLLSRREGCPWTWTQLEDLAYRDAWEFRAKAWDTYLNRLRTEEIELATRETAREMAGRHAATWRLMFDMLARELDKWDKKSKASKDTPVFETKNLIKNLAEATKAERLIRGEATEVVKDEDLSMYSQEELEKLRELEVKRQGTGG